MSSTSCTLLLLLVLTATVICETNNEQVRDDLLLKLLRQLQSQFYADGSQPDTDRVHADRTGAKYGSQPDTDRVHADRSAGVNLPVSEFGTGLNKGASSEADVDQSKSADNQAQAVIIGRAWDLLFKIANDLVKLSPAGVPKDSSASLQGEGAEILNKRFQDGEVKVADSVDNAKMNDDPHSVDEKGDSSPQGNPVIRSLLGNITELQYNLIAWDLIYMFPKSKVSSDSLGVADSSR